MGQRTPTGLTLLGAIALCTATTIGQLHAQEGKPVIIPTKTTTATYGDWVLSCLTPVRPEDGTQKTCSLTLSKNSESQKSLVLFGINPRDKTDALIFSVGLQTDVWVQTGVSVASVAGPLLSLPFSSCGQGICYASVDATPDDVNKLRSQTNSVQLTYKDGSKADRAIPIPMNGFGDAIDALRIQ